MRTPLTTCLLSLAAGSLLVLPGAAHATVLACGDQLTQDTTLTADLHCGEGAPTVPRPDGTDSYASILIAADNVTLDLNGHEISSYTGDSIVAYGRRNLIIRNGTAWGISLDDTTDSHIHDIDTAGSFGSGIGLSGSHRNRIERNRVRGEAGIGLSHSTDNLVADNDIRRTRRRHVALQRPPKPDRAQQPVWRDGRPAPHLKRRPQPVQGKPGSVQTARHPRPAALPRSRRRRL